MEGFFCEKLLGRLLLLHLEEDEELFWDKLLRRGEFEVEVLLENNDPGEEKEPVSFFDAFLFSSITSSRGTLNVIDTTTLWALSFVCMKKRKEDRDKREEKSHCGTV